MLTGSENVSNESLRTRLFHVKLDRRRFNSPGAAGSGIYQCTVLSLQAWKKQKRSSARPGEKKEIGSG